MRTRVDGRLETIGYGRVLSAAVDPIEKKPLYHMLPGSKTLSIALFGCNFHCEFCQNFEMSQPDGFYSPEVYASSNMAPPPYVSPQQVVELMLQKGLRVMSYTYSDPIVWQDYMLDTAVLVHEHDGYNCMITNGSFSKTSIERVLPHIDAFNIDMKGDRRFYRDYCSGEQEPVLRSIERIAKEPEKILEVTTMVIEGVHTPQMIKELGRQLSDAGVQVWHLTRFFPHYRMEQHPATSEHFLGTLLEEAGSSSIPYIYAGNSINFSYEATVCPSCGKKLISSHGYRGEGGTEASKNIIKGTCISCGERIYGLYT